MMKVNQMRIWIKFFVGIMILVGSIQAQQPNDNINYSKLSPFLQHTVLFKNIGMRSIGFAKSSDKKIRLVLQTNGTLHLPAGIVHAQIGNVATIEISQRELVSLTSQANIEYIQEDHVELPSAHSNADFMNVSDVHRGILKPQLLQGDSSIVVIYDTGIDWSHLDFRRQDDTTKSRILFLWDQTETPDETHTSPESFSYGVEYSQAQIDAELSGVTHGYVRTIDRSGHGTAVAGVAVANGQSSDYHFTGIAPHADIIIIKGGDNSFSESNIIDGISYIDNKVTHIGKPVVLNLSLGSQYGAHDGSRLYEKAIDSFASEPSHIVVIAAGNDGDEPIHAQFTPLMEDSTTFSFTIPDYSPLSGEMNDLIEFEFWYNAYDSIMVSIVSPTGKRINCPSHGTPQYIDSPEGTVFLTNASFGPSSINGKNYGSLLLFDSENYTPAMGTWTVVVKRERRLQESVHFWLTENHTGSEHIYLDRGNSAVTSTHIVTSPGNATQAITVGAHNELNTIENINGSTFQLGEAVTSIASFSSSGPRSDGQPKPDIVAPGVALVSSLSHQAGIVSSLVYKDGEHSVFSGTSFSAPQITGLVALMLQVNPKLTTENIKQILKNTAIMDGAMLLAKPEQVGHGRIDGLKTLCALLNIEYLSPSYLQTNAIRYPSNTTQIRWKCSSKNTQAFELLRILNNNTEVICTYNNEMTSQAGVDSNFLFIDSTKTNGIYIISELDDLERKKYFGLIYPAINTNVEKSIIQPHKFAYLEQNFPNPFNPITIITFQLPSDHSTRLKVYDVRGREITTLAEGPLRAGTHTVSFDGSKYASGIYFYVLEFDGIRFCKKMQLVK